MPRRVDPFSEAVRAGYAVHLRHLLSVFDTEGLRARLAAAESGAPLLLDTGTICSALVRAGGEWEKVASRFNFRVDPARRWLVADGQFREVHPHELR